MKLLPLLFLISCKPKLIDELVVEKALYVSGYTSTEIYKDSEVCPHDTKASRAFFGKNKSGKFENGAVCLLSTGELIVLRQVLIVR